MRRLVVLAVLAACSKPPAPGPSCAQITDHMLEITKQQLAGHGDQQLGDRSVMIEQCEKRKLSREVRDCLMAAKTLAAIAACQPAKPAPRAPAPGAAPAPPTAPPTGSGG
jgi:hypothetical protein